jgi:cytidine deaminase
MEQQKYIFDFDVYDSIALLQPIDSMLLQKARETTTNAYAPYSRFNVGAAAILNNKEIITGTNQENASYPVGICAERVLLSAASAIFPGEPINTIAISYNNLKGENNRPIYPCGICRQSLVEFQERFHQPIRLILGGMEGKICIISNATHLLPFSFTSADLG